MTVPISNPSNWAICGKKLRTLIVLGENGLSVKIAQLARGERNEVG
jgi:hypothetical protein